MKKLGLLSIILLINLHSLFALEYSKKEIIIRLEEKIETKSNLQTGVKNLDNTLAKSKIKKIESIIEKSNLYIYSVYCENNIDFKSIQNISTKNDDIVYVQPNYINKMLSVTPDDPYFASQWALPMINAQQAWDYEKGSEHVVIGVIDSGIDYTHPDLADNIWINENEIPDNGIDDDNNGYIDDYIGWDFTDAPDIAGIGDYLVRDNDPIDDYGHGTHIMGIISAVSNNERGVTGISWYSKVMAVRAGFRVSGGGYLEDDDAAAGIIYAVDNGAQVISISWGDEHNAPIIQDACNYANELGCIIIASAGNEAKPKLLYPAALSNVMSVAAIGENKQLCWNFSSYGENLDLTAPGINVISTYLDNSYEYMSGTSMATPCVAGAAALLLSKNMNLTNTQIRCIINSSCDDLGEPGYDIYYGNGLLNIERMIKMENYPIAKITNPQTDQGFSESFPITGTATSPNFFRYSLTYTTEPDPTYGEWYDIIKHTKNPTYYYESRIDTLLGEFVIPASLKDDVYYIKLTVQDKDGSSYQDIVQVYIDITPPYLDANVPNNPTISKRYNFNKYNYFLHIKANENVNVNAKFYGSLTDTFTVISTDYDSITTLILPPELLNYDEDISCYIRLTNRCGLQNENPLFFNNIFTVDNSTIPVNGYTKICEYSNAFLCHSSYDINGNGKKELILMKFGDQLFGTVEFLEKNGSSLVLVDTMDTRFQVWDIADTDGNGCYEILGTILDSIFVYEAVAPGQFPSSYNEIWHKKGALGGMFADVNGNDTLDLLICCSESDSMFSFIDIYKRDGSGFTKTFSYHSLIDTTNTVAKNRLSTNIQAADLDRDGLMNVLAGDIDGDIIVFEVDNNYTNLFKNQWNYRLPVPNGYYLGIGDFDGDGQDEFVAGGYAEDVLRTENQVWVFMFFKNTSDNQYELYATLEISGVASKNGVFVADVNNDGIDELIVTTAPDLYVMNTENGTINMLWVGESYKAYRPYATDLDNDGILDIVFNQKGSDGEIHLSLYNYDGIIPNNFLAPQDFVVRPINNSKIHLSWRQTEDALKYKIYRRLQNEVMSFYDETNEIFYNDINVEPDSTYYYQVSAVSEDSIESYLTKEESVVASNPPCVLSVKMTSLNRILILYDSPLNATGLRFGNYKVNKGIGSPKSASFTQNSKGVIATFDKIFTAEDSVYTIHIENVEGFYGAKMDTTTVEFNYEQDTERPYITSAKIINKKEIEISFNETIMEDSATVIDNYQLLFPEQTAYIKITSIGWKQDKVNIYLSSELIKTNEKYFIEVTNVYDLAGNEISNVKNKAGFTMPISDLEHIIVYPNPVIAGEANVKFENLPSDKTKTIYIYDFCGQLIREQATTDIRWDWNLKNSVSKPVASGIYFFIIKYENKFNTGKIAVIR